MYALEFETVIKAQTINLPNTSSIPFGQKVRVIMLYDLNPEKLLPTPYEDIITRLTKNPIIIQDFSPMTREEIYDSW